MFLGPVLAIILLVVDDWGFGDSAWHPGNRCMPFTRQLAEESLILDNLYSHPTCTPSRTALLTSKYASDAGMEHLMILRQQNYSLGLETQMWSEVLSENGVETALFGKYHLGSYLKHFTPSRRGFNYSVGYYGSSIGYYDQIERNGRDWFENGQADFNGTVRGRYTSDVVVEKLQLYLEKWRRQPLFLYLATQVAHQPMELPPKRFNPYCNQVLEDENLGARLIYNEMMAYLDVTISDIFRLLGQYGLNKDNTIFYLSSDNNAIPSFGGWPYFRGEKGTVYEGGVRIPGLLWGRGVPEGHSKELLHLKHIVPKMLDLAGWFRDKIDQEEDEILLHLDWCECPFDWSCSQPCQCPEKPSNFPNSLTTMALRYRNFKIIYHGLKVELYDLEDDPFEVKDLSEKLPDVVLLLTRILKKYYDRAEKIRNVPCDPTEKPVNGFWLPHDYYL
jgi:arylsulfatase A-like enzyme